MYRSSLCVAVTLTTLSPVSKLYYVWELTFAAYFSKHSATLCAICPTLKTMVFLNRKKITQSRNAALQHFDADKQHTLLLTFKSIS